MNINKIFSYMSLLFVIAILTSCAKDKGNYEYRTLDQVTINLENIPSSYSIVRFDDISIAPKVTYKGETVDPLKPQFPELKFTWEMYPAQSGDITERYTLSESPLLKVNMSQREMPWEVLFTVTNTSTGIKSFAKFAFNITSALAEGWMVLYERNGNTDVGLITNNEISKNQVAEKLFLDIYSASNGGPMKGTPVSILFSASNGNPTPKRIYVHSTDEISIVNPITFGKIFDFNQGLFWSKPAVTAPLFLAATDGRKEFLINNNRVHTIDYTSLVQGERAFGDALTQNHGVLAPWMATSPSPGLDAAFYDQTNKRFLKIIIRGSNIIPFNASQTSAAFDVNNVGMEFLKGDQGWNNYEYMVMKDNLGKHWLLSANFKGGDVANIGKAKYDMSACPEIESLNSVTAGYLGEIFYYSANNHLYQFKYIQSDTELLWTAPAGEIITNIALQKYYYANRSPVSPFAPKNHAKILYIATYNESTKTGSVYQVEVNGTRGEIIPGTEKKYTGFGKIKAMAWKPNI